MQANSSIPYTYLSVIESIKDAIIVRDLIGKIFFVNSFAEKLFGFSPGELIGKNIETIIPPIKASEEKRLIENLLWGEQIENYETERIAKNGNLIYVSVSLSSLKDEEGKIIGITKVIRDITDKKKAEGKFQALLETAPDAMVIVNKFGQIVLINAQTEKLFGYERAELLGKEVEILIPKRFKDNHPGHRKHFFSDPKTRSMGIGLELFATKKDGTEFPVEISISPLKTEEGMFVSAAIRDISERKKVMETLKQSEEKFNKVFHLNPAGITLTNVKTGKWLDVNESFLKMLGYQRDEIIGKSSADLGIISEKDQAEIMKTIKQTGGMRFKELNFKKKSGETAVVMFSNEQIFVKDEPIIVSLLYDITDRKKAEAALEQKSEEVMRSNQELEQFAYVASHDLQEPLRNITNYVELLHKRLDGKTTDENSEFLNVIVNSAERMKTLINELLDFSRIGRNRKIEKVNCTKVLSEVLADMDFVIQENKAKIKSTDLPIIKGNEIEIKQLFQNLLSNALKFKKKDVMPEITISCRDTGKEWEFSFIDNGIGIKKEHMHKMFLIFQRLHSEIDYPGTGIGLATCKKIVELNEGRIWVKSTFGKGSTFLFTIQKK